MDLSVKNATVETRPVFYILMNGRPLSCTDYSQVTGESVPADSLFSRMDDFKVVYFSSREAAEKTRKLMLRNLERTTGRAHHAKVMGTAGLQRSA